MAELEESPDSAPPGVETRPLGPRDPVIVVTGDLGFSGVERLRSPATAVRRVIGLTGLSEAPEVEP